MSSPSSSSRTNRRPSSNLHVQITNYDNEDNHIDLLMRHSSPIDRLNHPNGSPSPIMVRNSSMSPIGLSRPRSNPRNRTPMRYESPLPTSAFRIPEEHQEDHEGHSTAGTTTEGRRITILPMAGSARGTIVANFRNRQDGTNQGAAPTKSRKQGPSHRKVRRWNNDNFVNLAKEVGGSNKAAEALLRGHAHAGQYRHIIPQEHSQKSIMTKLTDSSTKSEELRYVRDKFYEGELHSAQPQAAKVNHKNHKKPSHELTRDDKMNRIDKRLRQVVTRAIENSLPATKVMDTLEDFLIQVHTTNKDQAVVPEDNQVWNDILSHPPTISRHGDEDKQILVLRFSFDNGGESNSNNGGFHRLLLHALVQFHGLAAYSATTPTGGRLLTATGYLADANHKLVDSIMQRRQERLHRDNGTKLDEKTNRMNALKV